MPPAGAMVAVTRFAGAEAVLDFAVGLRFRVAAVEVVAETFAAGAAAGRLADDRRQFVGRAGRADPGRQDEFRIRPGCLKPALAAGARTGIP